MENIKISELTFHCDKCGVECFPPTDEQLKDCGILDDSGNLVDDEGVENFSALTVWQK